MKTEDMMALHMACLTAIVDVCEQLDVMASNTEEWKEAGEILREWVVGGVTDEQASQYFKEHIGLYQE